MLKASDLAFGECSVPSVRAPGDDPHGGIGIGGSTAVEDVVGSLRIGSGFGGVTWGKPGETFGIDVLVAVDDGGGNLLGHAFEEGFDFGEAEFSGVAVEIGDIFVDYRVGFEVSASVGDLRGGGFCVGDAVVEESPSGLGKANPDGGFVSGGEVAFDDEHIVQDFVGLREEFYDRCHSVPIVHPLGPVSVS